MITESIKRFIERADHAFVASADKDGQPHIAAGRELKVPNPRYLVFNAWFCSTTLQNLAHNPLVAVALSDPSSGKGFQFTGRFERREETAVLNGYEPGIEPPGMPQVQSRLVVLVEKITAFSAGAHTDQPIG